MQNFSGSGTKAVTTLFTAPLSAWYDLQVRLTSLTLNGSAGLVVKVHINSVEKAAGSSPPIVYGSGVLPFGTTLGLINALTAYGAAYAQGYYASYWLDAGDTLGFSVATGTGVQPAWALEFSGDRQGDTV